MNFVRVVDSPWYKYSRYTVQTRFLWWWRDEGSYENYEDAVRHAHALTIDMTVWPPHRNQSPPATPSVPTESGDGGKHG
jgi:hypothetical protein